MTNKEKYIEFCKKEIEIPIFSQYWWLDVVCGKDNWDVALVEKGGHIMASMPYFFKKRAIFNIITMPRLTQTMGAYIKYPIGQKYYKKLSFGKEMINELLSQLPKYDYFIQNFDYSFTNWQPFYWNGFKQTTAYTYVIENISLENLEKEFETDTRRRRRKANNIGIKIVETKDIGKFYELNKLTYDRKNMNIPYNFYLVKNLFERSKENDSVKIFSATFEDKIIASGFFVYDTQSVYYIMGGVDPDYKDLGAMDALLYEAIRFTIESNRRFDFEGSMVESIEKYFRSFGAKQKPMMQISRTNSKLLKIRELMQNW